MTVLEVLQSSAEYFKKHQVENARLNAEHLLAHALGKKRLDLYLEFERKLGETELVPMRDFVRRRGQGEPLQHLLGTVEFGGQVFRCDKRSLVPRPETEELVELLKTAAGKPPAVILDVGTGSGVIALSLAVIFPEATICGVDISEDALALARENAVRLDPGGRVQFVRSNLLKDVDVMADLIVANLPYVSTRDRESLSREVLHDPPVALFGGEQGDELVRELIEEAPSRLRPGGLLALEIGAGQSGVLEELLRQKNYHDIESKKDYAGIPRFLLARYG
jgi:release factor glutamine methyltransferase